MRGPGRAAELEAVLSSLDPSAAFGAGDVVCDVTAVAPLPPGVVR